MKQKTKEVVINNCFGGFGISDLAYEELIKLGIPVRKYKKEPRNPKTGLYDIKVPNNEGKIIFDRKLEPKSESDFWDWDLSKERYWDTWIEKDRENPMLIKVIKKLGKKANTRFSKLKIVKIPADIEYIIEEYDGFEHIAEKHQTWS